MTPVLIADSIGKSFGRRRILTSAGLQATAGRITVVVGRNGAGKSTLLKIAAGILVADHGTVRFCERLQESPRLPELARLGLFYLPDRRILSPFFSVRRQLEVAATRFPGRVVSEIGEGVGLKGRLDRAPWGLSGGEQRRAELALALVRGPSCLLADEPLRGIDPKDAEAVLSCFRRLARDGCAVVISGHEIRALLDAAHDVVWITAGTSYLLGSTDQALANERFRREYLTGSWA